jgi:hypothetical protein
MGLQILVGIAVGIVLLVLQHEGLTTRLFIPFFKRLIPDLRHGYLVFAVFVLVASRTP